jgi:transposase-like protein
METETVTKLNEDSGLMQAIRYFSDPMVCVEAVAAAKWPKGPECPRCQSKKLSFVKTRRTWTCLACRKQFSVKVGTIFEDSPIGLDKWLTAMWMLGNCKNGVSSYEIARALEVTQKTAWFMNHRIRYAQHHGTIDKMTGHVEADESFIGGEARNMHKHKRAEKIHGRGPEGQSYCVRSSGSGDSQGSHSRHRHTTEARHPQADS